MEPSLTPCFGENKFTIAARVYLLVFAVVILLPSHPAHAQPTQKVARIGYLSSTERNDDSVRAEAIRSALREIGYIEGQSLITEYRYAAGKLNRLPDLAAELVRLKVDIIVVAGGSGVIRAAKNATNTIPIVMTGSGLDPVEAGLIESLSHPGGNITGLTDLAGHLGGKRLELLKESLTKVGRVAILYQANNPRNIFEFKEVLPASAQSLQLTLQSREVRDEHDFERAFAAIKKERPDGLLVLGGPMMNANQKRTVAFASKSQLPSVYDRREAVDAGGLMFYGADVLHSYRRVAWYVDKILKGAKPADLPVEQPTKFELVINLKTAKQIRLSLPPNVLARADKVIR